MKPVVFALAFVATFATVATAAAQPGESAPAADSEFVLQTRNTSMVFQRSGRTWLLVHYGPRVEKPGDAIALATPGLPGGNTFGHRKPSTYSVFGSDNDRSNMNKYGGLAVIHADGVTTTELQAQLARRVDDKPGVEHLVLELRDAIYPFHVTQHFRAIHSSDVIETWVELNHTEPAPVKLVRMDSAALVLPARANQYSVLSLTGQWGSESQLSESPVGLGQIVSFNARSGVRASFVSNPSFMLSIGTRATETTGTVMAGALAWSGAWQVSIERDQLNTIAINAGSDTGNGAYTLEPNRTLVTPKLALTYSTAGKGQVSRNLHRWAREHQLRNGTALRPVLLNSWEGAYFKFNEQTLTDMMDGVKQLGGEMFVVDDGWFGRGKYARDNDRRGLGDWVLNEQKLPRGLSYLASEAKSRGLAFGIWVEPEMANTTSELVDAHPDWVLREKTRPLRQGRGGTQVVLDLTNPAVRDNLFQQLDAMISATPGLAYIKWDANADFMNPGSTHLPADRQPNLWFDYTAGLYNLLGRLNTKHPAMEMQACGSGGGRMDYGFLRYADEFWTSDNTDARQRVFIQWGAGHFYPACAMAAHVTAVPNHQTHRTTPLKYRFDVAMSGRLGFELHPKDMSPEEITFAQKAVADYKRLRPVIQQGDLYRLVSPYENTYASLMYVNDDKTQAVVFVYGLNRMIGGEYPTPIPLQGLAADKMYRVTELNRSRGEHSRVNGKQLSGAALLAMGLPVRIDAEYDSAVFELTAEPSAGK